MIDLPPPSSIWVPPKPAIIRPAEQALLRPGFLPTTRAERRRAVADLIRTGRLTKEQAANALVVKLPPAMAMLMVNQLVGFGGAAEDNSGITLTFINSSNLSTDLTTYDHGDFNAATAGLMIVLSFGGNNSTSISTVSIGGTNGTATVASGSSSRSLGIHQRQVSSGNNNVTITYSGAQQRSIIFVFLLVGNTSDTAVATQARNNVGAVTTVDLTANFSANSVGILGLEKSVTSAPTWSSATSVGNLSTGDGGSNETFSAATKATVSAITPHVESPSWTGSTFCSTIIATWA